jgi:signal transduction histidine kinase
MTTVAEIIHQHETEIMRCWFEQARAAASARGLSTIALGNLMPLYLAALADQFETGQVDAGDRRRAGVQSHLSTRIRQGFDLAEILDEFVLLGRCIASVWQALPQDEWPSSEDVERLHLDIHLAMIEVTDTFHRHMLEDEQSEKRYLRQLQAIASESLHDRTKPLRDRLRDVLEVVMEAMHAQCAAFLLHDLSRDELVLVACVGAEALEPYATSLRPTSFAGEVASHAEPTRMYDVTSTRLDVPDELRRSGIHSLLGVRLPPRNSLLGVMYIGISETREFTPREVRRIESLGERLALHLENARLFAELSDKILALDVEKTLRERFVSTLAHDLRGPLMTAQLGAERLALHPPDRNETSALARKIEHNIERVDHMIRDLLDANRIRAGEQLPVQLAACDLVAVARQVADEARARHGDRFVVVAEQPVRGVWAEDQLRRALWNLVTNAVKYGVPDRPITLSVARHGDIARISVHNHGAPIPSGEQAHIFDPYARASAAIAGGRMGWGLGLTLVRGVAEAHGGHVSVASNSRSGTTFTIEMPVDARTPRAVTDDHASVLAH